MVKVPPERIQKVLARTGAGSRRQIESWIAEGRITVNGRVAGPGEPVVPDDEIRIDGRTVSLRAARTGPTRVLAYYKPAGEVCTRRDEKGRPTVFQRLPRPETGRWIGVGRLDFNTSGLLLFTNDGDLANTLMHPSRGIEREYAVRVLGRADAGQLERLCRGVKLEDGPARFNSVADAGGEGSNHWYRVVLTEGRKHEVRRLWESQGLKVTRLIRVRFGPYALPRERRTGEFWHLQAAEVRALERAGGMKPRRARK